MGVEQFTGRDPAGRAIDLSVDGRDASDARLLAKLWRLPSTGIREDPVAPGTPVPTGPALSKARARSGEHVARRAFELDAARAGAELGTGQLWHGMEVTAFDGTTAALDANDELDAAFGVPAGGRNPMLRLVALVRTATHRWAAAAIGGYHDGENALADQLEADRNSSARWASSPTARPAQPLQVVQAVLIGAEPGQELAAAIRATRPRPGSRTRSPGWSSSPS